MKLNYYPYIQIYKYIDKWVILIFKSIYQKKRKIWNKLLSQNFYIDFFWKEAPGKVNASRLQVASKINKKMDKKRENWFITKNPNPEQDIITHSNHDSIYYHQ